MSKIETKNTQLVIDEHVRDLMKEIEFFNGLLNVIVASIGELEERVERLERNESK